MSFAEKKVYITKAEAYRNIADWEGDLSLG
jgi:hypothetical protein